ncbi:MAG: glycoside hydrolase family 127 protein [Candidatus Hydrogenedentes bacterium]|nr:glycoside hydrolase family 127 protein [Candidatus Hydrogenedentota bacterium]
MKDFKNFHMLVLVVGALLLCSFASMASAKNLAPKGNVSDLAARVPRKVVVGQDVYQAPEPGQVSMKGFLGNRMDINREARLKKHITEDMLLVGFRKRPGSQPWIGEHVGKWLHAATLAWENKPNDTTLAEKIQRIANGLMDCQMEDGYLGTYAKQHRWAPPDKNGWDVWVHKYVLIGLLSYYRSTGDERALETCRRVGDLLIQTFGDDKRDILKSGTHAGMAATSILEPMSLLYEYTGDEKYRQFCQYVIRRADAGPKILTNIEKNHTVQSVGNKKAYEMMSNYVGLVENWRATGYERGLNAAELAWESIANENVFITGAPDAHEHFSEPHTLVTTGKCTETCVQVTWIQMNWQLLRATGDPRYAAMLHHHIYNHMLAAQNPDGIGWCYFTTMEGSKGYTGKMHCCGSSGPRAIALIPTFAYMTGKDKLAINLYETSTFRGNVNGTPVAVHQQTNYPWDGRIAIDLQVNQPTEFDLQLLVPNFVKSGTIQVAGSKQNIPLKAGKYATIHRKWSCNTKILLQFDMPLVVHQRNERYALSRGPIVLALEKIQGNAATSQNVIPDVSSLQQASWKEGETGFKTVNQRIWAIERHPIYLKGRKTNLKNEPSSSKLTLVYRPYCEAGTSGQIMSVWLPTKHDK